MAATSFPRSRSPVLSIRTQKEDENALRAQIAAANRTQHEILPRYSWHQGVGKKISPNSLRERTRTLRHGDTLSRQSLRLVTTADDVAYEHSDIRSPPVTGQKFAFLRQATKTKKPWKQLSRRKVQEDRFTTEPSGLIETNEEVPELTKLPSSRSSRSHKQMVDDEGQIAQGTKFDPCMPEESEETHTVTGHPTRPLRKNQNAIRKSVYGSLSSTKNFFRTTSKAPLMRLHSQAASDIVAAPHLYSFDNKDQLRDYLNETVTVSPLSPMDHSYRTFDTAMDKEPVELSAGPLPAELEGNGPDLTLQESVPFHSVSSPSIRDLPPYVDSKEFYFDLVKEQGRSCEYINNESQQKASTHATDSVTCNSCSTVIATHEIYDFCSICDTRDRIFCVKCAKRGPCCQHELEQLLCQSPSDQPMIRDQSNIEAANVLDDNKNRTNQPSMIDKGRACLSTDERSQFPATAASHKANVAHNKMPEQHDDLLDKLGSDIRNLQLGLVTEMSYLRREQDLIHRERELALRSREIDLKGHEVTLKEREAVVQRNAEAVNKNMDKLLSYQGLAKTTFIGSQFDLEPRTSADRNSSEPIAQNYTGRSRLRQTKADIDDHQQHHHDKALEAIARVEASLLDSANTEAHIKSYTTQKRKKNTGNGSTGSTPAASSSPAQSRKSLSRGNSERDASQDDGDEEGDDDRRSPKKHKQGFTTPEAPAILFACPYAKHDPTRFSSRNTREKNYRGCATHYLPDVSRLKQHLKRVHWQPETYCPRCYEEFEESVKLAEHAGFQVACCSKICPFPEKMDKSKQDKIHVKRPRVPQDVVWYDIYKVLFPGSPLPESPYMDGDDRIATPISATPQSAVPQSTANMQAMQAMQMLSGIFNDRLNQHDGLKDHPSRGFIDKTLTESFAEILNFFSISPTASPAAGPSIVVSPVSRSSSGTTQLLESPLPRVTRPTPERPRSITSVATQSYEVPRLQQPKPPRPKIKTALEVPRDHHRSLSGPHSRSESVGNSSPADVIFDLDILPHIQNDPGYDEECLSFEQGDDLQAMAFVSEPSPPSFRNKSVMSIDSGYGSGRSQQHPTFQQNLFPASISGPYQNKNAMSHAPLIDNRQPYNVNGQIDSTEAGLGLDPTIVPDQDIVPDEHSVSNFQSYSNFLDSRTQDEIMYGIDYPLSIQYNPWNPL